MPSSYQEVKPLCLRARWHNGRGSKHQPYHVQHVQHCGTTSLTITVRITWIIAWTSLSEVPFQLALSVYLSTGWTGRTATGSLVVALFFTRYFICFFQRYNPIPVISFGREIFRPGRQCSELCVEGFLIMRAAGEIRRPDVALLERSESARDAQ